MADAKKSDLKLFGEIDKRVVGLGPSARDLLKTALKTSVSEGSIETVRQIVERHSQLSPQGKEYVGKQLFAPTSAPEAPPASA